MTRRVLFRKIFDALLTIAFIAVINFVLFRMIPGDPTRSLLPRNVSAQQRQAIRARLGLDQPLLPAVVREQNGSLAIDLSTLPGSLTQNQLVTSFANLLQWPPDLGSSFSERAPVIDVIAKRFWPTVLLVGTAEAIAFVDRHLHRRPRRLATRERLRHRVGQRLAGALCRAGVLGGDAAVLLLRHAGRDHRVPGPADGDAWKGLHRSDSTRCSTSSRTLRCRRSRSRSD